jgi:protein-tyrosine-phosphatase
MNILFVCSGNTCRSPMAEALFRDQLKQTPVKNGNDIKVRSAGLYALAGQTASREAIQVMAEMGLDISRHTSRDFSEELIRWADLILTMTDRHAQYILSNYTVPAEKLFTLGEFSQAGREDITDPYGGGKDAYQRSARQIKNMINGIFKKLS